MTDFPLKIRRILVALDSGGRGQTVLDDAMELATRLGAELMGLFIEDERLFRLALLPIAHEQGLLSREQRPVDREALERRWRAQAEAMRRAMSTRAETHRLRWSFEVVRGNLDRTLKQIEVDLVVLERPDHTLPLHSEHRRSSHGKRPVVVFFDGGSASTKALQAAAHLTGSSPLTVLLPAPDRATTQRLTDQARQHLTLMGTRWLMEPLSQPGIPQLTRLCRRLHCRLLLLDAASPLLRGNVLDSLRRSLDCPLILVR